MSRAFSSLSGLSKELLRVAKRAQENNDKSLETIGQYVETVARAKIGDYQAQETSPQGFYFPEWDPLKEATEQEKERLGYSRDEPELREGDMRDSITHDVRGTYHAESVAVGSSSIIARAQELGYAPNNLPPRPSIGPAMGQTMDENLDTIRQGVNKAFQGR